MPVPTRHAAVGLLLLIIPVVAVVAARKTDWGAAMSTPAARVLGDAKAKLTIVEYSDFQCPSCAKMHPVMHDMLERYKGKIRVAYKYYPLTRIHKNAVGAARAAECAAVQNKFWPFADELFATQAAWSGLTDPTTSYVAIGQKAGVDMTRWQACYTSGETLPAVERDSQEAKDRAVNATPTFFIGNERLVGGVFASDGARAIEKALRQ